MTDRLLMGDIEGLPVTLTTAEAARLLGVTDDHLWALRRLGTAPVEPLKLGRAYRWPTAPLLALLGLDNVNAKGGAACSSRDVATPPGTEPLRGGPDVQQR